MNLLRSIKLTQRLVGAVLLVASTVGIGIGWAAVNRASVALEQEVSLKLSSVLASREAHLDSYLGSIIEDLEVVSTSPTTVNAVQQFAAAWSEIEGDPGSVLQQLYIRDNPHPTGEKDKLYDAGDSTTYSAVHAQFHPWFHRLQQTREYYDVFLFDTDGDLVYSVFKELDYATNLVRGEWQGTDLAKVFAAAAASRQSGFRSFTDFSPYAPSADAPASFIASPILTESGDFVGVLAFQMPVGRLNALMADTQGLGETGETYIVGDDLLMRTDSRFSEESTILVQSVESATVMEALKGNAGIEEILDYRDLPVISSYEPFDFEGVRWALMAEIDESEFSAPVRAMQKVLFFVVLGFLTGIGALGFILARGIARPIVEIAEVATILAGNDTSVSIPHTSREDEIGFMAQAVDTFKAGLIERGRLQAEAREAEEAQRREEQDRARLERERVEAEHRASEEHGQAIESLIGSFEGSVRSVLDGVAAAASELEATSTSMAELAESANSRVTEATGASQVASENVEAVASASEELSHSISEISEQVGESARIAGEAVSAADEASGMVRHLADDVGRIGTVIGLINDIAEQTNLLALNATIEAARAGEAGKGFAVVASEVKALATQTANATGDIESQISSVQGGSEDMAKSVEMIREVISQTQTIASGIAAAVEQQNAATSEISRSAQGAADNTARVSTNMDVVSQGSVETRVAAEQVLGASQELARNGVTLQGVVDDFLEGIRAL
jgi:methyl-accepting chemotaxis protein